MRPVTLSSERVRLSPACESDPAAIAAAISDPDIAHWIAAIPWPYTEADGAHFVDEIARSGWNSGQHLAWVVSQPGSSDVLGAVGLTERLPAVFEVGYWLTPSARGRGLATESVRAACRFAFDVLGAQRVEWQAAVGNNPSRAVAERSGITIEGTARHRLTVDGRPADTWLGSLLPGDPLEADVERVVPRLPVELAGERIALRAPTEDLVPWVVSAYRDEAIVQWNPSDVTDEQSARRWIQSRADWSDGTHASWVVFVQETAEPAGALSIHKVKTDNLSAAIGYWTATHARGQGVATEAVAVATQWALGALGLKRLELIHAVENAPSCAVAQANQFLLEGTVRLGERYGDGRWYDEHIHGRTT